MQNFERAAPGLFQRIPAPLVARGVTILASIALLGTAGQSMAQPSGPQAEKAALTSLRSAEVAVKTRMRSEDEFFMDGSPEASRVLEARWAAARRWVAAWLDNQAGVDIDALTATAKKDAGLELSAVRLDGDSLAIASGANTLGAVFILRREKDGHYVTVGAFDESETWGAEGPPALAAWRSDRAASGCRDHEPRRDWATCGPLVPSLTRLPDDAAGGARFAVVGRYVKAAGATDAYQLSIWRWSGGRIKPLLVHTLDQMADDPVIVGVGANTLTIHEKSAFKRMVACGACSGRQLEVVFDLSAGGARLASTRSLEPELDTVDEVYDRLFQSKPTDDLASPEAASVLMATARSRRAEAARSKLGPSLGLVTRWIVAKRDGVSTLCLRTESSKAPWLFTFSARGGRPRIETVRELSETACDGPDARS